MQMSMTMMLPTSGLTVRTKKFDGPSPSAADEMKKSKSPSSSSRPHRASKSSGGKATKSKSGKKSGGRTQAQPQASQAHPSAQPTLEELAGVRRDSSAPPARGASHKDRGNANGGDGGGGGGGGRQTKRRSFDILDTLMRDDEIHDVPKATGGGEQSAPSSTSTSTSTSSTAASRLNIKPLRKLKSRSKSSIDPGANTKDPPPAAPLPPPNHSVGPRLVPPLDASDRSRPHPHHHPETLPEPEGESLIRPADNRRHSASHLEDLRGMEEEIDAARRRQRKSIGSQQPHPHHQSEQGLGLGHSHGHGQDGQRRRSHRKSAPDPHNGSDPFSLSDPKLTRQASEPKAARKGRHSEQHEGKSSQQSQQHPHKQRYSAEMLVSAPDLFYADDHHQSKSKSFHLSESALNRVPNPAKQHQERKTSSKIRSRRQSTSEIDDMINEGKNKPSHPHMNMHMQRSQSDILDAAVSFKPNGDKPTASRRKSDGMDIPYHDYHTPQHRVDSPMPDAGGISGSAHIDDLMNIYQAKYDSITPQMPTDHHQQQPNNNAMAAINNSYPAVHNKKRQEPRSRSPHPVRGFEDPSANTKNPQNVTDKGRGDPPEERENEGSRPAGQFNSSNPSSFASSSGGTMKCSSTNGSGSSNGNNSKQANSVHTGSSGASHPSKQSSPLDSLNMLGGQSNGNNSKDGAKFSSDMSVETVHTIDSLSAFKSQTSEELRELIEMMQAEFQKLREAKMSAEMRATTLETDLISSQQEQDAEFVKLSEEKERWRRMAHEEKVRRESALGKVQSLELEREKAKSEWGRAAKENSELREKVESLENETRTLRKLLKAQDSHIGASHEVVKKNGRSRSRDLRSHNGARAKDGSISRDGYKESMMFNGDKTGYHSPPARTVQKKTTSLQHPQSVHGRGSENRDEHLPSSDFAPVAPASWYAGKKRDGSSRKLSAMPLPFVEEQRPAKQSDSSSQVRPSSRGGRLRRQSTDSTARSSAVSLWDSNITVKEFFVENDGDYERNSGESVPPQQSLEGMADALAHGGDKMDASAQSGP